MTEASHGLSATAELLVFGKDFIQLSITLKVFK